MTTNLLRRWLTEEDGQDMIEYALLCSFIGFAAAGACRAPPHRDEHDLHHVGHARIRATRSSKFRIRSNHDDDFDHRRGPHHRRRRLRHRPSLAPHPELADVRRGRRRVRVPLRERRPGRPRSRRRAGWVTGLFLFMPLFLLGGMGAGDVKLLAALGAWLGPGAAFWLAIYASMAGGVLAVVVALRHSYLGTALKNLGTLGKFWWLFGLRPMASLTLERGTGPAAGLCGADVPRNGDDDMAALNALLARLRIARPVRTRRRDHRDRDGHADLRAADRRDVRLRLPVPQLGSGDQRRARGRARRRAAVLRVRRQHHRRRSARRRPTWRRRASATRLRTS